MEAVIFEIASKRKKKKKLQKHNSHWRMKINKNCLSSLIKFVFNYKHFKIPHSKITEGYSVLSCNVVAKSL